MEIKPEYEKRLHEEKTIYLTTVRPDGTPHLVPIWFLWENGTILFYSQPKAQKLKNVAQNPKVALSFNMDVWGDEYLILMGEAKVLENHPLSYEIPAFVEKYQAGIAHIQMSPESMAREFSVAIRVTPTQVRGG
jgi:PPOX class probable F420-dependent enzyme